jgi:hypothetical protein
MIEAHKLLFYIRNIAELNFGTRKNKAEHNWNKGINMDNVNHYCRNCGDEFDVARWKLGYKFCLECGDVVAKKVVRTVVPMHKSNYVLITDLDLLSGVNNKGGIVK